VLREAVSQAQIAFETHDRQLRDKYLNATGPAEIDNEESAEEQRRRSLMHALCEAQAALAAFEEKQNIAAVEAELADIRANGDSRERAAARQEMLEMLLAFDKEVLRVAEARWAAIRQRLIDIENRWPGQRTVVDLPHLVDGIFYPCGPRSICAWYREVLCAAAPELFDPSDPIRQKIDVMRAERNIRIYFPLPLEWRL